jgi:hypothetical protein
MKMKNRTYKLLPALMAVPFAFLTVACGGDEVTAENITLEECNDLFGEVAESESTDEDAESEDMVEGDYNGDGEADSDDEDIAKKCEELMAEDAGDEAGGDGDDAAAGDGDMPDETTDEGTEDTE